jgi:menaquinone-dependent protoporphyrinogen IX oxidase
MKGGGKLEGPRHRWVDIVEIILKEKGQEGR